jgi:hypothetical protein
MDKFRNSGQSKCGIWVKKPGERLLYTKYSSCFKLSGSWPLFDGGYGKTESLHGWNDLLLQKQLIVFQSCYFSQVDFSGRERHDKHGTWFKHAEDLGKSAWWV